MNKKTITFFLLIMYLSTYVYNYKIYSLILIFELKIIGSWYSNKPLDKSKIQISNTEWMSNLKDSVDVRELAVPGTHDSCTFLFLNSPTKLWWYKYMYQCQSWSIEEQLFSGIRYFDLRPAGNGIIYHGEGITSYTMDSIFEIYKNFLNEHPSEGLFVRVQFQLKKCEDDDIEKCKQKAIYRVFDKYNDILYRDSGVPTVGKLRKKIYAIIENLEYKNYLIWEKNDLMELQDYFKLFGVKKLEIKKKKDLVREYMFNQNKEKLVINHCSGVGRGISTTINYVAFNVNKVPYIAKGFRGIFAIDFPGEKLVNHIINQNKKYFKSEE